MEPPRRTANAQLLTLPPANNRSPEANMLTRWRNDQLSSLPDTKFSP